MSFFLKVAVEQGFAFLIGLLFVSIVGPETNGGIFLLIVVGMAIVNVFTNVAKWLAGARKSVAKGESESVTGVE